MRLSQYESSSGAGPLPNFTQTAKRRIKWFMIKFPVLHIIMLDFTPVTKFNNPTALFAQHNYHNNVGLK